MSDTVLLKNVRLAFPQLWTPRAAEAGGTPRYGAAFIIEPGSENEKACEAAIKAVATAKWGTNAAGILKALIAQRRVALRKEERVNSKGEVYRGFEGMHSLNASNRTRPTVVDRDRTPLTAEDGRPYGGCYVNARVSFWAQDKSDPTIGKRVNCTLLGVQFVRDGEAFGAQKTARPEDFEEVSPEDNPDDVL